MTKRVNPDAVIRKLTSVSNTQDSISMLGVWIICNKHEHKLIANKWLEVLKSAKSQHQLTLLYLCNDVIQKCSRKNASVFKKAFEDVIPEAITHIRRDESIRKSVERVLAIWKKRKIYDSELVDQLMATLVANRPPDILKNKLLAEYKTTTLIEDLTHVQSLEEQLKIKKAMVEKLQPCDIDKIMKLKDKEGGKKFKRDFEDQRELVRSYKELITEYLEFKKTLFENLQNGQIYYQAQYHEAKVVAKAYRNYETRLLQTKQGMSKVNERVKALNPSPPQHDIPSPGGSVDKLPGNDDMDISDDEQFQPANADGMPNPNAFRGANDDAGINLPVQLLANAAAATMDKSAVEQIIRSANMAGWKAKNNECQSPPSPVGSSDLNIASPPRHQSLDSRLADIFMDGGMESMRDNVQKEENSDAGSLAEDAKVKEATNFLPGLGGIINSLIASTANSPKSSPGGANSSQQSKSVLSQQDGISIPVIQGLTTQANYVSDSAATPTQDEVYTPGELAYDDDDGNNKKGIPKTQSLDFLCSFMKKNAGSTTPPSQTQDPQSAASDFATLWNDNQGPRAETAAAAAAPPPVVETNVIPPPFQPPREATPPRNEDDANAWLAAYSPPPSDWQSDHTISTTPPLPPSVTGPINTKPPMPPGPEPPQINDISPIRARTSSRDRIRFDQHPPMHRRNSDVLQRPNNNNLITLNHPVEPNNGHHYHNNSNNISLTPVKDRDLRQPIKNNCVAISHNDRPMMRHDNATSPPPFPAFARQDSNGAPPQFSPKYEEIHPPFDDHHHHHHHREDDVMVSRSNSVEQQRFAPPTPSTTAEMPPNTRMMHRPETPLLSPPRFPYMTPPIAPAPRGNLMRPREPFTGPPNHSLRRTRPPFNNSSPGPDGKRFRPSNPPNNNFHGEPHQNRPLSRHNNNNNTSGGGNNFNQPPPRSPRMRFRGMRPSNHSRFARNNLPPFEPRGSVRHRGSFPRMYNS